MEAVGSCRKLEEAGGSWRKLEDLQDATTMRKKSIGLRKSDLQGTYRTAQEHEGRCCRRRRVQEVMLKPKHCKEGG